MPVHNNRNLLNNGEENVVELGTIDKTKNSHLDFRSNDHRHIVLVFQVQVEDFDGSLLVAKSVWR